MNMAEVAQQTERVSVEMPTDWKSFGFTVGIILLLAALAGILIHQSHLPATRSRIDLDDLLLDHRNNRLSDAKIFKAGAFVVSSWVVLFMTAKLALTEWALLAYMGAWTAQDIVIAARGKLASPAPAEQPPPEKDS